jgi:ATP-binding cassette subfamily F protein uup
MLARAMARPSNLLVLDEPTNDLDLETLDLLQEMIADYPGTVLVVSHDRDFLDRVATSVIAYEGEGRWQDFAGGYSDMVAQRGHGVRARIEAQAAAPAPKRAAEAQAPALPARQRLTMGERQALKTLPGEIEKLSAEIAKLNDILADPQLYARDAARFAKATELLAQRQAALAAAEERWLELEMRREEAEATPAR